MNGIKNYFKYQKIIINYNEYEKKGQMLTTYLDEQIKVEEETDFLSWSQTHPDKYKEVYILNKLTI